MLVGAEAQPSSGPQGGCLLLGALSKTDHFVLLLVVAFLCFGFGLP